MSWIIKNDTIEVVRKTYNEYNEYVSEVVTAHPAYVETKQRLIADKTGQNRTSSFLILLDAGTDILDSDTIRYNSSDYTIASFYNAKGFNNSVTHIEVMI